MKTEVLTISKFRDGTRAGDDVPLVLPGVVYGVFDGATDPYGTVVDGIGAGRVAALAAAASVTRLTLDPANRRLPKTDILARITQDLAAATAPLGLEIPPSTTLAVALDLGSDWRFLALGDSGFRLNGSEVLHTEKIIDAVSTTARVMIFNDRIGSQSREDEAEEIARRALMLGMDRAVAEGMLSEARAAEIITQTAHRTGLDGFRAEVEAFLRGGIRTQFQMANLAGHPLGFDTLNGTLPARGEGIDVTRPKAEIHSIEIFSDGYPDIPAEVSLAAWEAAFAAADAEDYHKIGRFATVKGTTASQFFDDRTVLVMRREPASG